MAIAFRLSPRGPFSLDSATSFADGFPGTDVGRSSHALSFTWPVDDDWRTARVTLRQPGEIVLAELTGHVPDDLARSVRRDLERILSLDVDGTGFDAVGRHDRVVGTLQRRFPGLRPVLFFTPYEATAWTIIGHRIRMTQAAAIKKRLADELGKHGAFPAPARLADLNGPQRGLSDRKVEQLRALGEAAAAGRLSRERLRSLPPEEAEYELQRLPGIGPFSAELIRLRGSGDADGLPRHERRLIRAIHAAYDLDDDADIEPISENWRPYRAWVSLLLRAWLEAETQELARGRRSSGEPRLALE